MTNTNNGRGGKESKKTDVSATVLKTAAGIAIASGVIAAGVALSHKENRKKLGKAAKKGMDMLQNTAENLKDRAEEAYPVVQHAITKSIKTTRKTSKSRKASR